MEDAPVHSIMSATIPKGSTVLVTGVTGFIASHVADQLLQAGYHVRGTSRSKDKADWMVQLFSSKYGENRFEVYEVPDMMADTAFDESVKGVAGIAHLASILSFSNNPDEVIPPTVKGTLNILKSASKEPSIKSVVYTSSSTAVLLPEANKEIAVTKDTWNQKAIDMAYQPDPNGYVVYGASKTMAEKAFWEAIEQTKPPFQTSAVLPNTNFGPILDGGEGSSTGSFPIKIWKGDTSMMNFIGPQYFVDVRDTARLHVAALIDPACNGQRIFAFAEPFNWADVIDVFKKINPEGDFPAPPENEGRDLSKIPNEDAVALLQKHFGQGWVGLEESLRENVKGVDGLKVQ
ncbi:hypothetical protein D0869_00441 [Hortaea werneckii]|uniref:NAD-dependent epimerase/dehydratase domain-containing protein n=1 Tax=Hortaea werneckii TaxID=91943 RepID=A0A3M6XGR7_HORWE|nr:hypothetical protein D0869_00441 [Hortaea werneckii]